MSTRIATSFTAPLTVDSNANLQNILQNLPQHSLRLDNEFDRKWADRVAGVCIICESEVEFSEIDRSSDKFDSETASYFRSWQELPNLTTISPGSQFCRCRICPSCATFVRHLSENTRLTLFLKGFCEGADGDPHDFFLFPDNQEDPEWVDDSRYFAENLHSSDCLWFPGGFGNQTERRCTYNITSIELGSQNASYTIDGCTSILAEKFQHTQVVNHGRSYQGLESAVLCDLDDINCRTRWISLFVPAVVVPGGWISYQNISIRDFPGRVSALPSLQLAENMESEFEHCPIHVQIPGGLHTSFHDQIRPDQSTQIRTLRHIMDWRQFAFGGAFPILN